MRRRAFLAALGTGVLANLGSRTAVTRGAGTPSITVESDPVPAGAPFEIAARVARQYSDEDPPLIAVELRNASDRTRTPSFGTSPPFSTYQSVDDRYALLPIGASGVMTAPVENPGGMSYSPEVRPDHPVDSCWRSGSVAVMGVSTGRRLRPGEAVSREYLFLQSTWTGTCFPAGTARFVVEDYDPFGEPWGLTVTVSYA